MAFGYHSPGHVRAELFIRSVPIIGRLLKIIWEWNVIFTVRQMLWLFKQIGANTNWGN